MPITAIIPSILAVLPNLLKKKRRVLWYWLASENKWKEAATSSVRQLKKFAAANLPGDIPFVILASGIKPLFPPKDKK